MSFSPRTRQRQLTWALLCLLVAVTTSLLVWLNLDFVDRIDRAVGEPLVEWTSEHGRVESLARAVQYAFRTLPMIGYTAIAAAWLTYRGFRRTAVWVIVVMVGASLTTAAMKLVFDRPRPVDALLLLNDKAFPSGHSSGIAAAAGVAMVLAQIFLRRRSHRRLVAFVSVSLALLVGLDRLLLGVHGVTDVVAGYAIGAVWVLGATYLVDPWPKQPTAAPLSSPVPGSRKLAVVLNPIKVEDIAGFKRVLEELAAAGGWSVPTWYETTIEDPGRSMAEHAAIDGVELVVVCGGDGTVRTVCSELAGTGIPVGVVPAGTGNLLARNLDLPLHLRSAIDVALNGQDRAIDLVKITGDGVAADEHFLVMAGMGFDAAIMEGANDEIKAKVGWLAYVVSGLRNLMFPAIRVEISVDGGVPTKHRARTVVVGNVGFLQAGLPLLPDAAIDDGQLDVVLVNPRHFLSWLRIVVRVLTRARRTDETLERMTGRTVTIRATHDTPRQIDGDPIGAGRELTCECLHGRLLVRVPR